MALVIFLEEEKVKKLFIDAEIDIRLLSVEEALLLDSSANPGLDEDDDDAWLPGIW